MTEASVRGDKPAFYVGIIRLIQQSDYAYWLVAKFMQPAILNLMGIPAEVYGKFTPVQKQMAQEMLDDASHDRPLSGHRERRGNDPA